MPHLHKAFANGIIIQSLIQYCHGAGTCAGQPLCVPDCAILLTDLIAAAKSIITPALQTKSRIPHQDCDLPSFVSRRALVLLAILASNGCGVNICTAVFSMFLFNSSSGPFCTKSQKRITQYIRCLSRPFRHLLWMGAHASSASIPQPPLVIPNPVENLLHKISHVYIFLNGIAKRDNLQSPNAFRTM